MGGNPDVLWAGVPSPQISSIGLDVTRVHDFDDAIEALDRRFEAGKRFDALVSACSLDGGDGASLLDRAREDDPDIAGFLYGDLGALDHAPVCEFYSADESPERVARAVREALDTYRQRPYPVPADEDWRAEVIQRVDFEAAHEELTAITRSAADTLDVDIVVVSVVDAHEGWLAARSDGKSDALVSPRGDNACAYAIADGGEPTAIEDLWSDARLEHTNDYRNLGLRAYLGVPLRTAGATIATLSALDRRPREFDEAAEETLRRHAVRTEACLASNFE